MGRGPRGGPVAGAAGVGGSLGEGGVLQFFTNTSGEIPWGDRGGRGAAVGQHQPGAVAALAVAVHRGDPLSLALAPHAPIFPQGCDTTTADLRNRRASSPR